MKEVRLLLDSGSTASFITWSTVKSLGLKYRKAYIPIATLGSNQSVGIGTTSCMVYSKLQPETAVLVEFIILSSITSLTPTTRLPADIVDRFSGLQLADPKFHTPAPIDILLRVDVFANIVHGQKIIGQPSAINTSFGWVVIGYFSSPEPLPNATALLSTVSLDELVSRFWQLEEPSVEVCVNPDDVKADTLFEKHSSLTNGRFNVPILLKENTSLGDSFKSALSRFYNLERRLNRQPKLRDTYKEFMTDYEVLGHMTLVDAARIGQAAYYIPHHCVAKAENPFKIRVVFDASMSTSNHKSLNDELLTGPKLHSHLSDVLVRFRLHKYVMTSDICKMYRQIQILPKDRVYQHILWRDSPECPL